MKIGIDIRNLSKPLTGIGRYTFELCFQLARMPNTHLYLYSPSSLHADVDTSCFQNHVIRCGGIHSKLHRQLWGETTLVKLAHVDKLDIYWGPAHRLPYFLSKKIPSVVTIHDLVYKYHPETMRIETRILDAIQMPLALKQATHVTTVSKATKLSVLKEFKCSESKISVIYNGVYSKEANNTVINDLKNYILFVGTLEPRKNLEFILKAYSLLSDEIKQTTPFVIVGGKGWGDINLKRVIAELSLNQFVHLLGYVSDQTLQSLYANALFLAMPSIYEGFGLPLIESMSYGVPVLTSNTSSMPEIAGNAGYIVNPFDVASIQIGLIKMITDNALRKSLASHAKENAMQFSWENSAIKLRSIFEDAILERKI
ncbi:MAG: glycosyltransferase family 1 protein [Candidatus Paracaedibacteraceae bacterium]|nr:glycosyltransferase family 1 protein [Candidatus Paracaedibacteraceae bacterium]